MLRPVKQTKGLFNPPATPVPPLGVKHTCAKPGCKKAAKHTCSVCESVYYCSPQHQLDHWPAHKQECSAATRAAPNPPPHDDDLGDDDGGDGGEGGDGFALKEKAVPDAVFGAALDASGKRAGAPAVGAMERFKRAKTSPAAGQ